MLDTLLGRERDRRLPDDLIAELVANPTLVFLKQFRDASCPTKACYQAIVEAPLAVHPCRRGYEALDPRPVRDHGRGLGQPSDRHRARGRMAGTPLEPELAFRATFDFDIQLGHEVWRAPT